MTVIHYIYMLKEDDDLQPVWSQLAGGLTVTSPADPLTLGLGQGRPHRHRGCEIVTRASGGDYHLCLAMMRDLAAIEIVVNGEGGGAAAQHWRDALTRIDALREKAIADATLMGETTLLVTGETGVDPLLEMVSEVAPAGSLLISEIDPAVAGGGAPLLGYLLARNDAGRDYYALAAADPGFVHENLLPTADACVKRLEKTSKYFAHQRQTIVKERARIDGEVSQILHQQVVTGDGSYDPKMLEEKIATLSRMFGVLATDFQLVRQATEQLEKDTHRLEHALSPIRMSGARDEIGDYFSSRFQAELARARAEGDGLDFSRGNAQAAIEVVRTQVDLLRAGEEAALQAQTKGILDRSLSLQEERLALQVAAGFIEFVLVFYYTLKSWEGVAGHEIFDHVPSLLRLTVVAGIAAGATIGTHSLAQALKRGKANRGLWLAAALIVSSLTALVILSAMNA